MNFADSSKRIFGAGVLALSLAVVPATLPAAAQNNSNAPALDTTPLQETKDDHNNWGWLGLLGLIGVANLFRKPKTRTAYRENDVVSRPGYRE